jgi:hypothetical protein
MKLRTILSAVLVIGITAAALAQEQGTWTWRASNKTAKSTTGDIILNNQRLVFDFMVFPAADIRPLKPEEVLAAFSTADGTGTGHLYRVSIPGEKKFLHKNTLCGSEETQWMATYVSGKSLDIVFFSNGIPPVFTPEGMNNNANLCGVYSYTR